MHRSRSCCVNHVNHGSSDPKATRHLERHHEARRQNDQNVGGLKRKILWTQCIFGIPKECPSGSKRCSTQCGNHKSCEIQLDHRVWRKPGTRRTSRTILFHMMGAAIPVREDDTGTYIAAARHHDCFLVRCDLVDVVSMPTIIDEFWSAPYTREKCYQGEEDVSAIHANTIACKKVAAKRQLKWTLDKKRKTIVCRCRC